MKVLFYILLAFLAPIVIFCTVGVFKISRRYHRDSAYREKMDKRALALKRKRKIDKKVKQIEDTRRYIATVNGYPEPLRTILLS